MEPFAKQQKAITKKKNAQKNKNKRKNKRKERKHDVLKELFGFESNTRILLARLSL